MNKTINFNIPLFGLDGSTFKTDGKEMTLGGVLAPIIAQIIKGDVLKLFGWAMAIYKNEDISLDKSDQNALKDLIVSSDQITVLVKAQLIMVLEA